MRELIIPILLLLLSVFGIVYVALKVKAGSTKWFLLVLLVLVGASGAFLLVKELKNPQEAETVAKEKSQEKDETSKKEDSNPPSEESQKGKEKEDSEKDGNGQESKDDKKVEEEGSNEKPTPPEEQKDSKPVLEDINFYVLQADVANYMTKEDIEGYHKLVDAVLERKEYVTLSDSYDSNLNALSALKDGPLRVFLEDETFVDDHKALELVYRYSPEEQQKYIDLIKNSYLEIINQTVQPGMNETDIVLALYKYFVEHFDYDYDWQEKWRAAEDRNLVPDIEILEALQTGKAVCHTYTYLLEFALQQFGIDVVENMGIINGDPNETHIWPLIRIDGVYYHFDPTWESESDHETAGLAYFGMTDEERQATGITQDVAAYDMNYGPIICDNPRFSKYRDVISYEYLGHHRWCLWKLDAEYPRDLDTEMN